MTENTDSATISDDLWHVHVTKFSFKAFLFFLAVAILSIFVFKRGMRKGRVWVVVLGDFGRSPRMQNHALSLAQQVSQVVDLSARGSLAIRFFPFVLLNECVMQAGVQVHVIAYGGSKTNAAITKHQNIRVHTIPELYVQNARSSRHLDAACEAGQQHDLNEMWCAGVSLRKCCPALLRS